MCVCAVVVVWGGGRGALVSFDIFPPSLAVPCSLVSWPQCNAPHRPPSLPHCAENPETGSLLCALGLEPFNARTRGGTRSSRITRGGGAAGRRGGKNSGAGGVVEPGGAGAISTMLSSSVYPPLSPAAMSALQAQHQWDALLYSFAQVGGWAGGRDVCTTCVCVVAVPAPSRTAGHAFGSAHQSLIILHSV